MSNSEIYINAFIEAFEVDKNSVYELKYESIPEWDSVGHMVLMAALEEGFNIMIDMEDIIDFSGFDKGKELLKKYEVTFE
jgi:acyl carrier protein